MARTTAPLFGLDASGSLAKSIVFSKWRGRTYVRRHAIPSNPQTGLQVGMRAVFRFISQIYAGLDPAIKLAWEEMGASDNITGLNAMMRANQRRARQGQGPIIEPDLTPAPVSEDLATATTTALVKGFEVTWTWDDVGTDAWGILIYVSPDAINTPNVAQLARVIPADLTSYQITGLMTGVEYHVRLAAVSESGVLGDLTTDDPVTPT